jgi:hypothetical protein
MINALINKMFFKGKTGAISWHPENDADGELVVRTPVDGTNPVQGFITVPFHIENRHVAKRLTRSVMYSLFTAAIVEGMAPVGILINNKVISPYNATAIDESVLWPADNVTQTARTIPNLKGTDFPAHATLMH